MAKYENVSPELEAGRPDFRDAGLEFDETFLVGTATAAYQIEGSTRADGRGVSIWDTFCSLPGAISDGSSGEVADDHYRLMRDDVDLMSSLGLGAYRFSVSWPRVRPTGSGRFNDSGLDFYDRLTDALVERGIAPLITLYHWDLPQELQDAGGWTNRDTAERFAEYAGHVAQRLGDRAHTLTTLNEPWVSAYVGYGSGRHAPGVQDAGAALSAVHHLNLAHGLGVAAMRAQLSAESSARMSVTLNLHAIRAADESSLEAVRRIDGIGNRVFMGPMLGDGYPSDVIEDTAHISDWGFVRPGDEATIRQPIDVLGINYYSTVTVRMGTAPARPSGDWPGSEMVEFMDQPGPLTAMGANIAPDALEELLVDVAESHPGLPLLITETGAAYDDIVANGRIDDSERIDFLQRHFTAVHRAVSRGVPLLGVMVWSFMDNFEWAHGYTKRFGVVHVDYSTQRRTVKASGRWLSQLARTYRLPPNPLGGQLTDLGAPS
jgi:beta-glucosidase